MQEAAAILGPQNRTQGRCAQYFNLDTGLLKAHWRQLGWQRSLEVEAPFSEDTEDLL